MATIGCKALTALNRYLYLNVARTFGPHRRYCVVENAVKLTYY